MQFIKEHKAVSAFIGALMILVIGLCCILSTTADLGSEEAPTAVATTAPTATTPPTPTDTPEPTATPTPTEIPVPTSTPSGMSEAEYSTEVMDIALNYERAMRDINTLSSKAGENPYLILEDSWRDSMAQALAQMLTCNERIRDLEPPPAYEETHGHLLDAADYFEKSVMAMSQGIDDMDADLVTQAGEYMSLGGQSIEKATDALP